MTWYAVKLKAWGSGEAVVEADSPAAAMQQAIAEWDALDFDIFVEADYATEHDAPAPTEGAA